MMVWQKSVTIFTVLLLCVITTPAVKGFAEGEPDAAGLEPSRTEEPEPVIKGAPFNPRRMRFGVDVTVNIEVKPAVYKGRCPAVFVLTGRISANKPTTVAYKIIRKDGPPMKPVTLVFDKPETREVSDTFTIGGGGNSSAFDGWAYMEAVFPVNIKIKSNTVFFSGNCTNPGTNPSGATPPGAAPGLQEDCVVFNPATTTVFQEKNIWKVRDGALTLFGFGIDRIEAENALAIIKHYRMNKSCSVGRPRPSFHYMLSGDAAPAGPFKGEVCKPFGPDTVAVRQTNNGWKIQDGERALIDFGKRKADADEALTIIKKHGFTHFCIMATGKVDYLYMRK
jgi:hypothetical protein